jgi:hypothetical protein
MPPTPHDELQKGEIDAMNIDQFCSRHCISRSMFYKLQSQRRGPRLMKVGTRTLITVESAAEWRANMERRVQGVPRLRSTGGRP